MDDDARAVDVVRQRLTGIAADLPDVRMLVLFGSSVRGRASDRSDVDVAVLADGAADLDALYLVLAPRLQTSQLDLVDLRHASPLLAVEVARSGHVVLERSAGLFRRFQSLAFRRYWDTKKLRDAQKRSIQVFLQDERLA